MQSPPSTASFVAPLRHAHGLTQRELADCVDVSIATIQSLEQGLRAPGPDLLPRLERTLALGERQPDEERPLYLVCRVRPGEPPDPYLDARQLPAVVLHRQLAVAVADLLHQAGETDATVVPMWWDAARRLLTLSGQSSSRVVMSRTLDGPARDGSDREPGLMVARAGRFVAETVGRPVR